MSKEVVNTVEEVEFEDQVVKINRLSKATSGGRRFSFSALVIVGDKEGKVGYGLGKARQVPDAIRKGKEKAKRELYDVKVVKKTIPHEVIGRHGATRVLLKPAAPGTGVIASGVVRAVCELSGIENILTKIISRSSNPQNVAAATLDALLQLRTVEEYAKLRDLSVEDLIGKSLKK